MAETKEQFNVEYQFEEDKIQMLEGKEIFKVSDMIRVLLSMPNDLPIAFLSICDNERFVQSQEINMAFAITKNTKGEGNVFVIATIGTKK